MNLLGGCLGVPRLVKATEAFDTCVVFSCFGRLSWKLQQSGSVAPLIAVVQAADAGQGDKLRVLAGLRDRGAAQRCVLLESKVRAVRVIQAGKPKPILPKSEKSAIRGIHAMASWC